MSSPLIQDLEWRGLLKQASDLESIQEALKTQQTFYCGFDPTADSLHIGNLLPLMALRRVQEHGHKAIAILGGGTGLIGDPSGKANERTLNTPEIVAQYVEKIGVQVRSVLDPEKTIVVNNADWISTMSAVQLLRDIGKNFSVSVMLARDSVASRLENGISFTEFTYMILQAYDFVKLFDLHGCRFQIGGSDQWGNMVSGLDLIRRMRGESAHVITFPLITTSSGKKFGKSEAGAIWMDRAKTSPYAFYQFWVNSEDPDVPRFLRYFTLLSHDEIIAIEAEHATRPELRSGHKRLAAEVTKLVHSEAELQKVILASEALFGGADLATADVNTLIEATASAPSCEVDLTAIPSVPDLLVQLGLATSKGDANRLLKGGGFYINNKQVAADTPAALSADDFLGGRLCVLRKGKRNYATVRTAS